MIKLAHKTNIIDIPNTPAKTHAAPVPYLGGIAVYFSLCITSLIFLKMYPWLGIFLAGTGLLCLTGLIDDKYTLDAKAKFILEGAGCVSLLIAITAATGITPSIPLLGLSLLFLWTIVNAVNLVDVMDLVASTTSAISLCGLIGLSLIAGHHNLLLLELITLGAILGFMWYNKKPAKIYLGDAGSLLLGGILGFFILVHIWKSEQLITFLSLPAIAGVILLEVIMLIIIRTKLGIRPYLASPHHFVHFLKNNHWSWEKTIGLTALAGVALNLAVIAHKLNYFGLAGFWTILFTGLCIWLFIVYRTPNS
jgi:UDP-GlcNAc:undecaprenyl-phosphate GlcNAc-1-phosphate transferase